MLLARALACLLCGSTQFHSPCPPHSNWPLLPPCLAPAASRVLRTYTWQDRNFLTTWVGSLSWLCSKKGHCRKGSDALHAPAAALAPCSCGAGYEFFKSCRTLVMCPAGAGGPPARAHPQAGHGRAQGGQHSSLWPLFEGRGCWLSPILHARALRATAPLQACATWAIAIPPDPSCAPSPGGRGPPGGVGGDQEGGGQQVRPL